LNKPPPVPALMFALIVQSVILAVPELYKPAPVNAEFPLIVQSTKVKAPALLARRHWPASSPL
jgi:hypothetical protein